MNCYQDFVPEFKSPVSLSSLLSSADFFCSKTFWWRKQSACWFRIWHKLTGELWPDTLSNWCRGCVQYSGLLTPWFLLQWSYFSLWFHHTFPLSHPRIPCLSPISCQVSHSPVPAVNTWFQQPFSSPGIDSLFVHLSFSVTLTLTSAQLRVPVAS